jgi:hypothetical protein
MAKAKISELSGLALEYVVGKALHHEMDIGLKFTTPPNQVIITRLYYICKETNQHFKWEVTADRLVGMVENNHISTTYYHGWEAILPDVDHDIFAEGTTFSEAVMRVVAMRQLGNDVEIPDILLQKTNVNS